MIICNWLGWTQTCLFPFFYWLKARFFCAFVLEENVTIVLMDFYFCRRTIYSVKIILCAKNQNQINSRAINLAPSECYILTFVAPVIGVSLLVFVAFISTSALCISHCSHRKISERMPHVKANVCLELCTWQFLFLSFERSTWSTIYSVNSKG